MIFTFGFGQECRCGRSMRSCYTVYGSSTDELEARAAFVELYGIKWSGCYPSEEAAGVARFELKRIIMNDSDPELCVCSRGPAPDYVLERLVCFWCDVTMGALVRKMDAPVPVESVRVMCMPCRVAMLGPAH